MPKPKNLCKMHNFDVEQEVSTSTNGNCFSIKIFINYLTKHILFHSKHLRIKLYISQSVTELMIC